MFFFCSAEVAFAKSALSANAWGYTILAGLRKPETRAPCHTPSFYDLSVVCSGGMKDRETNEAGESGDADDVTAMRVSSIFMDIRVAGSSWYTLTRIPWER